MEWIRAIGQLGFVFVYLILLSALPVLAITYGGLMVVEKFLGGSVPKPSRGEVWFMWILAGMSMLTWLWVSINGKLTGGKFY